MVKQAQRAGRRGHTDDTGGGRLAVGHSWRRLVVHLHVNEDNRGRVELQDCAGTYRRRRRGVAALQLPGAPETLAPPRTQRPRHRYDARRRVPARTGSNGFRRSSDKTAQRAARSAASSASSTICSTKPKPPCATKPASARSQQRPCCARSATPAASTANPSSPAGAAPAPSPCPQAKAPATPSSTASTSETTDASTACSTSPRSPNNAASPKRPPTSPARPPKARPDAKPDEPTNDTSPTASSAACGETKPPDNSLTHSPLDKGASDSPRRGCRPARMNKQ